MFFKKISEKVQFNIYEKDLIIEEIESHTGIIVLFSMDSYEFSHPCIQEYLAGIYILRKPISENILENMQSLHSAVAMSVSSSSEPTDYFTQLIVLLSSRFSDDNFYLNFCRVLRRIQVEGVYFISSFKFAGMLLISYSRALQDRILGTSTSSYLQDVIDFSVLYLDQMKDEVISFAFNYLMSDRGDGYVQLHARKPGFPINFPAEIVVPFEIYQRYLKMDEIS